MFHNIDVTTQALNASLTRYNQLANNVANVDTVNYKRSDVEFQSLLANEINAKGRDNINFNNVQPMVYVDGVNNVMRLDGNNVDIDKEMAYLSIENLRYNTLIERANAQIARYNYIFQNIR